MFYTNDIFGNDLNYFITSKITVTVTQLNTTDKREILGNLYLHHFYLHLKTARIVCLIASYP